MSKPFGMLAVTGAVSAISVLVATDPAHAQQLTSVTFACRAWLPHDVCHFSVLRAREAPMNFELARGEEKVVDGLAPEFDRYMVTINDPTPQDWTRCGRMRRVWCKLAPVRSGTNR